MACGANCPCQCVKPKRRRARKSAPPRRNPVLDLLSALLVQKHQEGINKPFIYKPEMRSMGTSTELEGGRRLGTSTESEKVAAEIVPRLQKPEVESPPLTSQLETAEAVPTLSSQLSALVKGRGGGSSIASSRRGSMESVMTTASDPALSIYSGASIPDLSLLGKRQKKRSQQIVVTTMGGGARIKDTGSRVPSRPADLGEVLQKIKEEVEAREGGGEDEFIGLG